jgi:hypothetical protein
MAALAIDVALFAQPPRTLSLQIRETIGIRRTEYPVSARVELAKTGLRDLDHIRLRAADADVTAQYSIQSTWDDGSVRVADVDFNLSIGPGEARALQLEYGPGITRPPSVPRGLTVVEHADSIQVGNVRFSRSGSPLMLSANYRSEFIGRGSNGLALVDVSGARHDLSTARSLTLDVIKRGPLLVVLRYAGTLPIDAGYSVAFTMTCEMPNSKSWVKTTVTVDDPSRRVRSVGFDAPLAFGEKPWTWDFGTDSGTYGVFRNSTDAAVLTQTVSAGDSGWIVQTGSKGELRPYESSTGRRAKTAAGWGHFLDARGAVAFAVERFAVEPGAYMISLNGDGQIAFTVSPAQPRTAHRLTVYEHFVSTPVAIGAATNPTAMVNPLVVRVR